MKGRYAEEVRAVEAEWQRAGIQSVPSIVINRQHLIQGGQSPEVFEQALRQAGVSTEWRINEAALSKAWPRLVSSTFLC